MKLGFVSAILPELSLAEVIDAAKETGYDCVELMCWPVGKAERRYAGVTHIDVTDFDADRAAEVQSLAASKGITISGLGYYPNLLSASLEEAEVSRAHLLKVIDASSLLGINVVNTFIGRDPKKSIEENWPQFLAVWPGIVAHAESKGVRIGIENCPMYFSSDEWPGGKNLAISPAVWRSMFEAIPSASFGLNYDPSHLLWQMMDPIKPIAEFGSRLVHAHAKDAKVFREKLDEVGILAVPLDYHSPVIPGRGDIDWAAFFSALRGAGYDGPVCVEVEDREFEGSLKDRKQALRFSAEALRPYL